MWHTCATYFCALSLSSLRFGLGVVNLYRFWQTQNLKCLSFYFFQNYLTAPRTLSCINYSLYSILPNPWSQMRFYLFFQNDKWLESYRMWSFQAGLSHLEILIKILLCHFLGWKVSSELYITYSSVHAPEFISSSTEGHFWWSTLGQLRINLL